MGSELPTNWTITKIAALGCDTPTCPGGKPNRKFLFAPEVVITPSFNAILVGSGDREHPLLEHTSTTSVNNAFFMVQDAPKDPDWWVKEGAVCGQALACKNSLIPINPESDYVPSDAELADKRGWYLDFGLDDENHDKEQVVTSAVVALGTVTFSTHTPQEPKEDSCGPNLGKARVYNLGFLNGRASGGSRYGIITGGGLPPSPVAGMVTVQNPNGTGTITVPFVIGAKSDSPLEGSSPQPAATAASVKTRAYWYLQQ